MNKLLIIFLLGVFIAGCTPTSKLKYTINTPETKDQYKNIRSGKTIQPDDYLFIKIYSLDETTNAIFDEGRSVQQNEQLISYNVNERGYISFPFVGEIYVKDLTIDEAKVMLEKELNRYLTNISVRIRFVGNKITVLGEVNRPGNYTFFDEKITIFEALGLASDVAVYGDKTKVTLIREKDNVITFHYLDLTNKNIAESEFYYLLPNDMLLIDPVKAKYRNLQDRNLIPLILTSVSSILGIYQSFYLVSQINKDNNQ
jgi:polysaccharide export outer membrane protein